MASLNSMQVYTLIAWSVFLWAVAAMKIRYLGPLLYIKPDRRAWTFIATIPMAYVLMRSSEIVSGASAKHRLAVTAIVSAVALVLDGLAINWFPSIYENPSLTRGNAHLAVSTSRAGMGWLLFGVGVSLIIALVM